MERSTSLNRYINFVYLVPLFLSAKSWNQTMRNNRHAYRNGRIDACIHAHLNKHTSSWGFIQMKWVIWRTRTNLIGICAVHQENRWKTIGFAVSVRVYVRVVRGTLSAADNGLRLFIGHRSTLHGTYKVLKGRHTTPLYC